MKITDPQQIKIGHWAMPCCELDLFQITSQEEINDIVEDWEDVQKGSGGIGYEVFETKEDALLSIKENK